MEKSAHKRWHSWANRAADQALSKLVSAVWCCHFLRVRCRFGSVTRLVESINSLELQNPDFAGLVTVRSGQSISSWILNQMRPGIIKWMSWTCEARHDHNKSVA